MAGCNTGDPMYFGALGGVAEFLDSGIDGILSKIANAILSAAVSLFADIASDIPTFPSADSSGKNDAVDKIGLQINWLVVALAVASLLFAAVRMAIERKGQAGTTAIKGIARMILVAGASSYVIIRLAKLGDDYTSYLYTAGVKEELKSIAQCGTDSLTAFLLIIIGLLLIVAGIIHIILLYIRLGVMVLLSGTLPLAAAASMTEWGGSWWRKHIAWMVAWLVFKPAVGLVMYAGAVMINATGASASQQKIAGCGVLLLSAVALPALLRLVVPAAAALGSSDGAMSAAGAAAGVAGKATGAIAAPAVNSAARRLQGPASASGSSGSGSSGSGSAGSNGSAGSSGMPGSSGSNGSNGRSLGRRVAAGAGRAVAGLASGVAAGAVVAATEGTTAAAKTAGNVAAGALPSAQDGDNR